MKAFDSNPEQGMGAGKSASDEGVQSMVNITLRSGDIREQRTREQLLRILERYPVQGWLFTADIRVQSMVRPHSHPVLTLNTRQLKDDDGLLGTFLHEQFHWYAEQELRTVEAVVTDFRTIWPEVPIGPPQGARSEFSSYLHLIICLWELDALTKLIGPERATVVIQERGYYTWIYEKALEQGDRIRSLLADHQLRLPKPQTSS